MAAPKAKPKAKAKQKAHAKQAATKLPLCLQDLPEPYKLQPCGYVYGPAKEELGRVATFFLNPVNPSAHCYCKAHGCSVWVTLKNVPEVTRLRQWLQISDRFGSKDEHTSMFNLLVYGDKKGPLGNGHPGG